LRWRLNFPLKDFLDSLSWSSSWKDNSGGKTGAGFIKTNDNRFVFKQLEKKEFSMLIGFADDYFKYMHDVLKNKQPSLLAKIYGIYEIVYDKKAPVYFIAMENLFCGMS
jgi:1-phosphatidylinositol-3-phosphate 5-kinase